MARERQFRGANEIDGTRPRAATDAAVASPREPGRQTLVEATLASSRARAVDRPGARTLVEQLAIAREEIVALASADASSAAALDADGRCRALLDRSTPAQIAARGVDGPGERLPFHDRLQRSFGRHDLGGVRAHTSSRAVAAARQLGARAFAVGDDIAFDGTPDLHTVAHEAAHVVQQRAGVALEGGIDRGDDAYEVHADEVADAVVRGESAEALLDQMAGRGASATPAAPNVVQRKPTSAPRGSAGATPDVVRQDGASWPVFAQNGLPYLIERRDGVPGFWVVRDWVASGEGVTKSNGAITSPRRAREILLAAGWVSSPGLEYAARTLTFQFGGAMVQHFQVGAQAAFAMGLPDGREAIVERGDAQGLRATVALDDASIPAGARHALTPNERQRALQAAADYTGLAIDPSGHRFLMTEWIVPDRVVGQGVLHLELDRAVCRTLFGQAAYDAWLGGEVPRLREEAANGPKLELENYYKCPIPGRLTHHGDLVEANEDVRFEVEVAWPRGFPDPAIYDAPPMVTGSKLGTVALLACSWTFERLDGASTGPVPEGWTRQMSTTTAEAVRELPLAPGEDRGTFRVTCAARFDAYFTPATFTRDVVVLSSRAAMSKLQASAFAGLGASTTDRMQDAWHADAEPGFRPTPSVDGGGEVDDPMARDRASQRERLRAVADYLRDQPSGHEAVDALDRELARQAASEKLLAGDRAKGWQPFQLRGTYLSRTEGLASGPLDLHGTVHVELAQDPHRNSDELPRVGPTYDKVVVQIRDLSRRFEQNDFVFRGEGRSFESALRDAFDDLAVAYPKGRVSIEAEAIRDTALRRGSGQAGPDAALGTGTGEVVGFQRSTDSTWKSIKQAVWDPVASFAVNLGAIALMTFVPPSASIVTPALIAYNSIPAVDRVATEASRGTLTFGTFAMSTGEVALNVLPMVVRARPFTAGWYAVETANWGGQLALMTAEAVQAARGLQATQVKALAEEYQQYLELQKTSLPSDPGLASAEAALREHAAAVDGEISRQFVELAKGNLIQMVAGSVVHSTSARAHEAIIEHLGGAHASGSAAYVHEAEPSSDAHGAAPPAVRAEHVLPVAAREARPPVTDAERASSLAMIDDGARNKVFAEQHAHEQGSVPIGKVLNALAERPKLTRAARRQQIDLLETLIQQATHKGQQPATVTDLSPAATHVEDGVIKAPNKVVIASIDGDVDMGLLNKMLRAKRVLQTLEPGSGDYVRARKDVATALDS